jgi:hypothetical protein
MVWTMWWPPTTSPALQTILHLCIPKKRFSQSTTYFQNRIIMFCLELLYSAENKMQSFVCQQREQHIIK